MMTFSNQFTVQNTNDIFLNETIYYPSRSQSLKYSFFYFYFLNLPTKTLQNRINGKT